MATLTLRNTKGSPLTNQELDDNFTNLNTDVASRAPLTGTGASGTWGISITGSSGWAIVSDSRNTVTTPQSVDVGVRFDFKANTTESLSDGGSYFGEMTFRQYGSGTDWSGGLSHQLGFTDNGNIWQRAGSSTTWGSWKKLLDSSNYNSYSPTLTGTGASGTWGISITGNAATATTATNISAYTINQNLGTASQVTFDTVVASNNGNGTNFRIGDDAWLGDINLANTIRLQGNQTAANGYLVFGNGDNTALGRAGTGALTYGGNSVLHAGNYGSYALPLAGGTMTGSINIDGSINFLRGDSEYSTYIKAATDPDHGFNASNLKYWMEIGSKGGLHVVLNTDGSQSAVENPHDHFTVWQYASNGTTGSRQFYVTNVGNVWAKGNIAAPTATITPGTSGVSTGLTVVNGDITTYRSGGTTGVIYLGNTGSRYLYYDGTNYSMPNGQLDVNGSRVLNAGNYNNYALPLTGGTVTGVTTFSNSSDNQLVLDGGGTTWAGIRWQDSGGGDYTWFNGGTATWSFGGGGSTVSGKKLHVHGATTIGSGFTTTTVSTNGLAVEGRIVTTGSQDADNYSGAIRILPNGTNAFWSGLAFPDSSATTGASNNYWFYGRGSALANRTLTVHIPNYSDYGSTGAVPSWGVYTTGATELFRVYSSGLANFTGSATFGGLITGKTNTGGALSGSNDSGSFSVRGDANNAAAISFHRPGDYAINLGLDTDNVFKVGGWSYGSAHAVIHAGNYNGYAPSLTGANASGTWNIETYGKKFTSGSLSAGTWYTIAANAGDRAYGHFIIVDQTSGLHQSISFDAAAHFGTTGSITVINNSFYSGPPILYIRLKQGGTYQGAVVQVYVNSACSSVSVYMQDNFQSGGWVLKNWVADSSDPGTVASWASLSQTVRTYLYNGYSSNATGYTIGYDGQTRLTQGSSQALRVSTDSGYVDVGSMNSSYVHFQTDRPSFYFNKDVHVDGQLYKYTGSNNTPYLHASNYNSYALPLSGGTLSGELTISGSNRIYAYQGAKYQSTDWADAFRNTPVSGRAFHGDVSSGGPAGTWWFYDSMRHSNSSNYWGTQIAYGWEDNANEIYQRNITANSFSSWVRYLNSNNYTAFSGLLRALGGNDGMNFNTTTYNSMYYGYIAGSSNRPTSYSYSYGTILTFDPGLGSGGRAQFYVSHAGNDLCFRGGWNNNDSWQAWNRVLTDQNYSSYALGVGGGTLTGSLKINTTGSGSTTSHVIIKRSGASDPSSFGSYAGSWRSAIEIWNNDSTKMLFLNPPENDSLYANIKAVGGGLIVGVGGSGSTEGLVVTSGGVTKIRYAYAIGSDGYNYPNFITPNSGADTNWCFGCASDNSSYYYMQATYYSDGSNNRGFRVLNNNGSTTSFLTNQSGTYLYGDTLNLGGHLSGSVATTAFRGIEFHSLGDRNYYIGKLAGTWTQPLDVHFYTGVRLTANTSYDYGVSAWNTSGTVLFSAGAGDNHVRVYNNLYIGSGNLALHAGNYSSYALPLTGGTITGPMYINYSNPTICFQDTDNLSAFLHCNSNLLYILRSSSNNGTSWSVNSSQYWPAYWDLSSNDATFGGALWCAGNITAYSDEKVKTNWKTIEPGFVEKLAKVRSGTFDRIDIKIRQVGVSAQSLQEILPEAVTYKEKEDLLAVSYGNAALASAVELAKELVALKQEVDQLKQIINKLLTKE